MKNTVVKIINSIPKYLFIIFVVLFSIANIVFTARANTIDPNVIDYKFGIDIVNVIIILFLGGFLYLTNKKDYFGISEKKYLIVLLIIVSIIGIYWIFSNPREFYSFDDSRNCFYSAKTILSGDYTPLGFKSYINTYPNNLTLVTYFMAIIKLFGEANAITAINIINLAFVIVGYIYIYKITKITFNNRRTNMNVITLMLLSLQFVFFSYYVYGNVLSISFSFISIYYLIKFIKEYSISSLILSGATICLAVGIKNNAMIVLVAEIIYLIIYTIIYKKYKCIMLMIIMMLGTFICTTGVIKYWEHKANYSYDNKLPQICWIAYGFNYDERHPGSYFDSLERYHSDNGYVVEYTKDKAKDFIKGVLNDFSKNPLLVPKFYGQKMLIAWTRPDYGVFTYDHLRNNNIPEINQRIVEGDINNLLNNIWDATLSVISVGLLIYIFKRRKEIELIELILAVVVIGGFLFHMFWELKSIYMYHYYLCLLPYAAHGLMLLFNKK